MLAQRPGARGGLVDAGHVLTAGGAAAAGLPGLGVTAAIAPEISPGINGAVALRARFSAPMLGGVAREVSGQDTRELLGQHH
jgi:hypothetical protein